MLKAKTGVTHFEDGGRDHKIRNESAKGRKYLLRT
jgi:hypothetical protein